LCSSFLPAVVATEVMLAVVALLVAMAAATAKAAKATVQPQTVKHRATLCVVAMCRWVC
jgi:hypothetical protein